MALSYAQTQRRKFIFERLRDAETLNRSEICAGFNCSLATVSVDLAAFREEFPGALAYDIESKVYRPGLRFHEHLAAQGLAPTPA